MDPGLEVYRRCVWYLRFHPEEQYEAWLRYRSHPAGALFRFVTPDGHAAPTGTPGLHAGDPLMVRLRPDRYTGWSHAVTAELRRDWLGGGRDQRDRPVVLAASRRPVPGGLTDDQLVWLARFQRRLDETLRCAAWRRENARDLVAPWDEERDGWNCGAPE